MAADGKSAGETAARRTLSIRQACIAGLGVGLSLAVLEVGLGIGLGALTGSENSHAPGFEFVALALGFWIVVGLGLGAALGMVFSRFGAPASAGAATLACVVGVAIAIDLILLVSSRGMVAGSIWNRLQTILEIACFLYAVLSTGVVFFWARAAQAPLAASRSIVATIAMSTPIWFVLAAMDADRDSFFAPIGIAALAICAAGLGFLFRGARRIAWTGLGSALLILVPASLAIVPFSSQPSVSGEPVDPLGGSASQPKSSPESSPVILIVLDTLRADHLGAYGSDAGLTPAIDALSTHATVFERSISTSPWTAPAHASIVTGLLPYRHGVHLRRGASVSSLTLSRDFETLGELFQNGGYETVGVVSNPWLSAKHNFAQGFARYWDSQPLIPLRDPAVLNFASRLAGISTLHFLTDPIRIRGHGWSKPYVTADAIFDSALELVDDLPRMGPPFVFLNLMDAHDPFEPPPPFSRRAGPEAGFRISYHDVVQEAMRESRISAETLAQIRSTYAGEIAYLDSELGRFFEGLKSRDLYENAWIIITSDHGEHLGENGLYWHRTSLYDPLVQVPMIIKAPGQTVARRDASLVQSMDLFPSLLQNNGIDVPSGLDAVAMELDRPFVVSELYADDWGVDRLGPHYGRELWAVSSATGRLIGAEEGTFEYVDQFSVEPTQFDGASTIPVEIREFYVHLTEVQLLRAEFRTKETGEVPGDELSAERLRQLRALGYAD